MSTIRASSYYCCGVRETRCPDLETQYSVPGAVYKKPVVPPLAPKHPTVFPMSPRYTSTPIASSLRAGDCHSSISSSTKARKLKLLEMEHEDPRYRSLDRMLAKAYVELMQKQKAQATVQKAGFFFAPRMDLCDDPGSAQIVAMLEVPGMKPEQLSVRIEGGRLIVEGERTGPHLHTRNHDQTTVTPQTDITLPAEPGSSSAAPLNPEGPGPPLTAVYPVRELKYGKFRREIDLPADVGATHVHSVLVEGMLTISWPRDPALLGAAGSTGPAAHVTPPYATRTNASV
ncbi:hypothetical protein GSI_03670 [Ganoderma sinense ZZ0214-1]|uniref:SHSP domain-containing protein n=1 Tax=Ganoderma sinense ZZ0214-1 TaxID=1077348 RepID=A0A2G8SJL5_9APHY|nr:hypothetical protein GSI_03670 [Ganoderma sinense ZZ0214-1]